MEIYRGVNIMRIIKYLLLLSLLVAVSISAWIYYPQYQLNKIKEESAATVTRTNKLTYLDYYRTSDDRTITHLALGDSIIHGYRITEQENLVTQFSNKLQEQTGKQVISNNRGIIGVTSQKLNTLIQEGNYDAEIEEADIITVNVGGNDVLRAVKKADLYSALTSFDSLQSTFSENLTMISAKISEINPDATIVFLELYNPMPADHQFYSLADKLLPKWNLKIYEVAKDTPASVVVQTTKVINSDNLQNLSDDGVHPSPSGYTAITEQMIEQFQSQYKADAVVADREK
jgi:lysophospholipase L1-like esterase